MIDEPPGVTAQELLPLVLGDIAKRKAVIDRARLIGGEKFAVELNNILNQEVAMRRSAESSDTAHLAAVAGGSTDDDYEFDAHLDVAGEQPARAFYAPRSAHGGHG